MDFSRLKCQLKRKKIDAAGLLRFSKFQPRREWVNKVNLSSFQLKSFFKFVLVWLACEKKKHLGITTCLHTLMQTHQSERTYYPGYFVMIIVI